jgi:hypothetical protein
MIIKINFKSRFEILFQLHNLSLTTVFKQCVRKVTVHLQSMLEVMSTSVYTGMNPFNELN